MHKTFAAWAVLSTLLVAFSGSALAQVIGNPVPSVPAGHVGIGAALEQFNRDLQIDGGGSDDLDFSRQTFQVNYGLGDGGAVQGYLANVRAKPDKGDTFSGQEVGINYRQTIDFTIPIGDAGMPTAILGDVRYGDLDDGASFDYFAFLVGWGGSYAVSNRLDAYVGVLYSEIWGEIGSREVNADDNLGAWGGVEYAITQPIKVGAEMHLLHEFGFAVTAQVSF